MSFPDRRVKNLTIAKILVVVFLPHFSYMQSVQILRNSTDNFMNRLIAILPLISFTKMKQRRIPICKKAYYWSDMLNLPVVIVSEIGISKPQLNHVALSESSFYLEVLSLSR